MSKENFFVKQEEEIATENQPIDSGKTEDNLEIEEEEERKRNLQNVAAYHFGLIKETPSKKQDKIETDYQEATIYKDDQVDIEDRSDLQSRVKKKKENVLQKETSSDLNTIGITPHTACIPEKNEEDDSAELIQIAVEDKEMKELREKIEKLSPEEISEIKKNDRYAFFADKKNTAYPNKVLTEQEKEEAKIKHILSRVFPDKKTIDIEDDSRAIEEAKKIKQEIITYADKLGIDVSERLPKIENIYLLDGKDFNELLAKVGYGNLTAGGCCFGNEIIVNTEWDKDWVLRTIRHELIHAASKDKYHLSKPYHNIFDASAVGRGFSVGHAYEYMSAFNEGMTELTSTLIDMDINGKDPHIDSYHIQVFFITELAEDLAKKLNRNPQLSKNIKDALHSNAKLTQKDIFTYLQKGMFEGDMKTLKVISEVYDRHGGNGRDFNAIKTLAGMTREYKCEEVADIARAFGLKKAANKIDKFEKGEKFEIRIANKSIIYNNQSNGEKIHKTYNIARNKLNNFFQKIFKL